MTPFKRFKRRSGVAISTWECGFKEPHPAHRRVSHSDKWFECPGVGERETYVLNDTPEPGIWALCPEDGYQPQRTFVGDWRNISFTRATTTCPICRQSVLLVKVTD